MNLKIDEATIVAVANSYLGEGANIIKVSLKQFVSEQLTRLRTHASFRQTSNDDAVNTYSKMSINEFEGINGRQRWANWRSVPRNLNGNLPMTPVKVVDLCCGVGHSSEVLAAYLTAGSSILGLEYNPEFVKIAQTRKFVNREGKPIDVRFRAQSVLESFCEVDGSKIKDASIDVVNCCGAVGHHFAPDATSVLAKEVARVVKPGGLALIDSGTRGTSLEKLKEIFAQNGFKDVHQAKSCFVDLYTQVCFKKEK